MPPVTAPASARQQSGRCDCDCDSRGTSLG
jgi:hypothetical protein